MEITTQVVDLFKKTLKKAVSSSLMKRPSLLLFRDKVEYTVPDGFIHTIRLFDEEKGNAVGVIEIVAKFTKGKETRIRRFLITNLIDMNRYEPKKDRARVFFKPKSEKYPLILNSNDIEHRGIVRRHLEFKSTLLGKDGKPEKTKSYMIEINHQDEFKLVEMIYNQIKSHPVERIFFRNFIRDFFFYPYRNIPSELKEKYLVWVDENAVELI